MKDFSYIIGPDHTAMEALKMLNDNKGAGLIVVGSDKRMLGAVTDGDIRRGLINGSQLTDKISNFMNTDPITSQIGTSTKELNRLLATHSIKIIPILDDNKLIDIHKKEIKPDQIPLISNPVVIMAGGLGSRLGKLTENCPKPMLPVGGKPLLYQIIKKLKSHGFINFFLSVNYKSEVIEDYFQDGSKFGCNIKYLREKQRLGTAGSLSLLPDNIDESIIVMNGDLLTNLNFRSFLNYHKSTESSFSLCARKYEYKIPYGVLRSEGENITRLEEKPTESYYVNAGIYAIKPEYIKTISQNEYMDMTTFINNMISEEILPKYFPITELWFDIGKAEDLEKARKYYEAKL